MKKIKFLSLITAILFTFVACETTDLDQLDNPNAVNPDQLDVDFLYNSIQLQFNGFVNTSNFSTQRLTRQFAMTGGPTYNNSFSEISFNGVWSSGYTILNNIKALEGPAAENGQTYHLGASKVMKAYVIASLADLFGDIPMSEALLGSENLFPNYDASVDVYTMALNEINEAISLLAQPVNSFPKDEIYFDGGGSGNNASRAAWTKTAKTIKLKMLNTIRLNGNAVGVDVVAQMTALINEGDLITVAGDDFHFNYGDSRATPNTRHPLYNAFYESDPGGTYLSNYFMWQLFGEKGSVQDPRRRFYFFRQDINTTNEDIFTLGCNFQQAPAHYGSPQFNSIYEPAIRTPFCVASTAGYWGRDHGDASGLPPDRAKRTVPGVYPAGGLLDNGQAGSTQNTGVDGFQGKGITPIMMSSWVDFIKAEAALELGTPGDPRTLLESGMRKSIDKTISLLPVDADDVPTALAIDTYVNYVLDAYDAAPNARKLEIIIKEYHIAAWGNGIEPYNNYRRTGYPSNLQPTRNPSPGDYFNTLLYPANSTTNNPNVPTNVRTKKVFWDTANLNLH